MAVFAAAVALAVIPCHIRSLCVEFELRLCCDVPRALVYVIHHTVYEYACAAECVCVFLLPFNLFLLCSFFPRRYCRAPASLCSRVYIKWAKQII